jgi:hypothetical protein
LSHMGMIVYTCPLDSGTGLVPILQQAERACLRVLLAASLRACFVVLR